MFATHSIERPFIYKDLNDSSNKSTNQTPLRDDIYDLVKDAQNAADEIKGKPIRGSDTGFSGMSLLQCVSYFIPRHIHVDTSRRTEINQYGLYNSVDQSVRIQQNSHNTYVNSPHVHSEGSSHEKKSRTIDLIIGIASAIVLGVCAYVGGKTFGTYFRFRSKIERLEKFKSNFETDCLIHTSHAGVSTQVDQINKVVKNAEKLFGHVRDNAWKNTAIAATIAAGAILTLAGACFACAPLIAIGGVIGGAGLVVSLFKWGMDNSYQDEDNRSIETIDNCARALLNIHEESTEHTYIAPPIGFMPVFPHSPAFDSRY